MRTAQTGRTGRGEGGVMGNYIRIKTSPEVWAVIRARHPELKVFGSYSAPDGEVGNPEQGRMFTSYGFSDGDFPIIAAQTTWDIDEKDPSLRKNEKHEYWLCVGYEEKS